jgi:hypothetical protein
MPRPLSADQRKQAKKSPNARRPQQQHSTEISARGQSRELRLDDRKLGFDRVEIVARLIGLSQLSARYPTRKRGLLAQDKYVACIIESPETEFG